MRPVGCKSLYLFSASTTAAKGAEPLGWDIPHTTLLRLIRAYSTAQQTEMAVHRRW